MQRKESDGSSVESFDFGQKQGLIIDFSMLYYVFENLLQKYFKIKKSSSEAQKAIKSIDDSSDESVESDDSF